MLKKWKTFTYLQKEVQKKIWKKKEVQNLKVIFLKKKLKFIILIRMSVIKIVVNLQERNGLPLFMI